MASPARAPRHHRAVYGRVSARTRHNQQQQQHQSIQNTNDQQQQRPKLMLMDTFKFEVYVNSWSIDQANGLMTETPLIHYSPAYIRCKIFFLQEGRNFLRTYLSNPHIPSESLDQIVQRVMNYVQQGFEFDESFASDHGVGKPWDLLPFTFPLVLEIIVDNFDALMSAAIEESMQQIRMIPASTEAIDSLKKFRFKLKFVKECNICLEDYDGDDDLLPIPCGHVFHLQCLERWLHNSHMCPLCRYALPTKGND